MNSRIRLVLVIHNHQPVGNFGGVFEDAYRDSYLPFLQVLTDYPEISIACHNSGSLLEWLVDAHPEYIDQVRQLIEQGQIEIIGGPFFEPILSCIPRRDRIGQIISYSRYLEQLFGSPIRGMWVPERVWEQSFARDITGAGIEYTILDDFHFRNAGLLEDQLHGYYLTEDDGRLLKVFPGSERLRYTIPFADPGETINYLRSIADQSSNSVVTFGDDGEKFGTWPGTKEHVYRDGWLRRFFDALRENSDWLKVATLAECVDQLSPIGKCYLPDSSYREMTEWALPTDRHNALKSLADRKQHDPDWPELQSFIRGGFWRNFRVKYPESDEMYTRMLQVSRRLDELSKTHPDNSCTDQLNNARMELYRAQCNCSYWHGAFGGLYMPHLRNAVYSHLIIADSILETIDSPSERPEQWVQIDVEDYNLDARKEIRIKSNRLVAFFAPARGGHLYELDVCGTRHNLLATLNRRPEPYHDKVREAAQHQHGSDDGHVASIHDMVRFKQPDLDKKLVYDNWPRKSLVDHFLDPELRLEAFQRCEGELGDFTTGVYDSVLRRSANRVELKMSRFGEFGPHQAEVTKTIALDVTKSPALEVFYELDKLPPFTAIHFGVELNFSGMAAGAADRYFYDAGGQTLGTLDTVHDLSDATRIGLVDEWLGLDVGVDISKPAGVWLFPIQTISQSEGGYELVHQSCAVVPHWQFTVPASGRWEVRLTLELDTSAAQAKQLSEATAPG